MEAKTRNRGRSSLASGGVTDTGKVFMLLGDECDGEQHVDPENLVLSLTRLRDFLVEREVTELSLPVYNPNRGRLHPRELYALIHVIFSDTNKQLNLHKKYYLAYTGSDLDKNYYKVKLAETKPLKHFELQGFNGFDSPATKLSDRGAPLGGIAFLVVSHFWYRRFVC